MNEPSTPARKAAESICDTFTVLARTNDGRTSFDEAESIDLAAIIERETGAGELISLVHETCGDHIDWLVTEYAESNDPMDPKAKELGEKAVKLSALLQRLSQ